MSIVKLMAFDGKVTNRFAKKLTNLILSRIESDNLQD